MFTPTKVYPSNTKSILVLVDLEDLGQRQHLGVLAGSFGEKYAICEPLNSRFCCLHLRPGKALKMLTRKFHTDEQGART